MNENVTSTIALWTGTVAVHSVGFRVTFLMRFLFVSPTSCSDHSLSVLSLAMGLQGSVGKWKVASPLVTSSMRPGPFQFSSSPEMHVPFDSTQQSAPLTCTRALKHMSKKCILHKSIFTSRAAYKGLSSVSHGSPSSQPAFQPSSEYYSYVGIL